MQAQVPPQQPMAYPPAPQQGQPQVITAYTQPAPQAAVVTQTTTTTTGTSGMREAIPALPIVLAVLLCVLNFIIPGLGTIIAGFSVLCCGNVGQSGGGRFGTFCINFWVGLLQLVLAIFVVGWVWSIIWGFAFIASSATDETRTTTMTTTAVAAPQPQVGYATTYVQPPV